MAQMKGLQQFITSLRASPDENHKRINHELINIQRQFGSQLTSYQRKKYVYKLIYIYLTSNCDLATYDVLFGKDQVLELVAGATADKLVGYLAYSLLFFMDDTIVPLLKADLNSLNEQNNALALTFVANNCTTNYAQEFVELVTSFLNTPTLKQKARLTLFQLMKQGAKPRSIDRLLVLDDDYSVLLSSIPLFQQISQNNMHKVQLLVPGLTIKLKDLLLDGKTTVPTEYKYNGLSHPWLIVKITKLLTVLLPQYSIDTTSLRTLRECVSSTVNKLSLTQSSIQSSVLFAMIELATHLDPSKEAIESSISSMVKLLARDDMNLRYLAMNSLILLSSNKSSLHCLQKYCGVYMQLLGDGDASVAKRSVELIYTTTDSVNLKQTIEGMFKVMKSCDSHMKSEIATKVSILAEKFGTDPQWYIDTMLSLIQTTHVNEHIWERIVAIVVNNDSLQSFTCWKLVESLKREINETMIKISALLLGEYGETITEKYSIEKQFEMFTRLYFMVSNHSRSMILTTLMKLFSRNATNTKMKSKLIKLLRLELESVQSELQQRSYEYLSLIQQAATNPMLLTIMFEPMPIFSSNSNRLVPMDTTSQKKADVLSPNWQHGYHRMFEFDQGIFFESSLLKIILRTVHKGSIIQLTFTLLNKSPGVLSSLLASLSNYKTTDPDQIITIREHPHDLAIGGRSTMVMDVALRKPFNKSSIPNLNVQFSSGAFNKFVLKLPVFLTKFISGSDLTLPTWLTHWKKLSGDLEIHDVIQPMNHYTQETLFRLMEKIGLSVIEQGQWLFTNGILNTVNGKFGVLVKLKVNDGGDIDISVRSTNEELSSILMELFKEYFEYQN